MRGDLFYKHFERKVFYDRNTSANYNCVEVYIQKIVI